MNGVCALYARQSDPYRRKEAGEELTLSIATQLDHCQAKASSEQYTFSEIADVFSENITSEVFEERPGLRRLIAHLERYKAIVVYKYDRITRDPDQLNAFIRTCQAKGIRVISCTEPEIKPDPISKMMGYIMGTVAQLEKIRIKERTMASKQRKLDAGLILGSGNARDGYRYVNGKRELNPDRVPIVERIFKDVASGVTLGELARRLNLEGVPAARVKWSQAGLGKIIRDPSYKGEPFCWGKTQPVEERNAKGRRKRVPSSNGKAIGGETPAIVSPEIWDRANRQLVANLKRSGKASLDLWLRGHVHCAQCGRTMTPHPCHNGKYEYRCGTAARGESTCCRVGFPIDEVEAKVKATLDKYFDMPQLIRQRVLDSIPQQIDWPARVADHENEVASLQEQLQATLAQQAKNKNKVIAEALEANINRLATAIEAEVATLEECDRQASKVRSQASILEDVDRLIADRSAADVLRTLGVRVYLLASDPASEDWEPVAAHWSAPDRKGRKRATIIRLFDFGDATGLLNPKTTSTSRFESQEIPAISL